MGVQLKHLLLDVDFFEKPKIKALQFDFGHEGVLLFIAILCDMSKGTNSEVPDSCIKQTAKEYQLNGKTIEEFIDYLVKYNLIHRCENPLFLANRRILQDQTNMSVKQDKWKKAKRKQRESIETSLGHMNTELLNSEHMNNEILNSEELILHGKFNTPEIQHALKLVRAKLKESGRPLSQTTLDAKCMSYANPDDLLKALIHTAGLSKTKNIYLPDQKPSEAPKKTKAEQILEMGAKL